MVNSLIVLDHTSGSESAPGCSQLVSRV